MPPDKRNPTAGNGGARKGDQAGWRDQPEDNATASTKQSQFGAALHAWERRRGERLAEEYLRHAERGEPAEFFAAEIAPEKLLLQLRQTAESAFLARIASAEPAGAPR